MRSRYYSDSERSCLVAVVVAVGSGTDLAAEIAGVAVLHAAVVEARQDRTDAAQVVAADLFRHVARCSVAVVAGAAADLMEELDR